MHSNNTISNLDPTSFRAGLFVQGRVLHALLIREMLTRYGRNNIGFLWLFVEPMLFTIVITIVWTATRSVHGSDLPIVAFALTGYSSLLMWRNMPNRCIRAIHSNTSLLFHRVVRTTDVYAARLLLEFGGTSASFVILGIGFWTFEWLLPPEDALQVLGGWLMLGWFGVGLALVLGSLSERSDLVERIWPPFSYFLFPFSGAAFLADSIPERMREILLYLPMLNCIEFLREGYFGSKITAHYDMEYVAVFNLLLTFFGLGLVRSSRLVTADE
ncbi:ABC-2 type transport system permease protein/capsular polysaccharide transport system permease protein [Sphingobium sp. B2D3A]|uniref:ABC transporter permease n=1 Tax=unclassified Sphingobium TaxID=2611147 RepID=UPI002224F762|nr:MULTISPECIES: ABC transporter permease [unclassified Sphingobium]MCW2338520.1 ABC-2 type transport system permease protein/capsular polysaccharide transport system permease protein [Sphingobium sp. B2D3A]MCW2384978.1 ABC-2 type transport system permease protein/capsular polysaccharide transport system permease protein [Sphingobium sp. B2D3D]